MTSSDSTWRPHPFVKGRRYLVRQAFRQEFPGSEFHAGVGYAFQRVGYSHADGSTVFTFRAHDADQPSYWWWWDDQADGCCAETFEEIACCGG
jgi:hypothetical protein